MDSESSQEISLRQREAASVFRTGNAARIIWTRRRDSPDRDMHWFRLVLWIGIERVLAGVENSKHIHLRAKPDVIAGFGVPLREAHAAILCHINPVEKIHVGNEVARSEPPLAQLNQEGVVTIVVVVVAVLLIARRSV